MKWMNKIILFFSSLGILISGNSVYAIANISSDEDAQKYSPLTSHAASKKEVKKLVAAIRKEAGGHALTEKTAPRVMHTVLAGCTVSLPNFAAALNELAIKNKALAGAMHAASECYKIPLSDVASAIVVESYINEGKNAAHLRMADIRKSVGEQVVNHAIYDAPELISLVAENYEGLVPSAGGSIYNE